MQNHTLAQQWTPRQTAAAINRSLPTLERWRRERRGPPFYRICGRVLYDPADVAAWIEQQKAATGQGGAL